MIFGEEIGQARAALREGWSVRIRGDRGSGRSHIARETAAALERSGDLVYRCAGEHSAVDSPGHVLARLISEMGVRSRTGDLPGTLDELCRRLSPDAVLVIDDTPRIDEVSLRALATLRERTGVRTVMTEPMSRPPGPSLPLHWPEHVITTRPLDLPGAGALAREILGSPLAPGTLTRVLTKTGGSPLLVATLVRSARHRGLLELRADVWTQVGYSMWNDDMAPVIDDLLSGESAEVVSLLRELSREPGLTADSLSLRHGPGALQRATERGLVRSSAAPGTPALTIWPPILAERFSPARVPTLTVGLPGESVPDWCGAPDKLASLATRFVESALERTGQTLTAWLQEPSIEHALAYYSAASGDPRQRDDLDRVLTTTPIPSGADDGSTFRFVYARAQWAAIQQHDVDTAYDVLEAFSRAHPTWTASADAAIAMISVMSGRGVPEDTEELLRPGPDPTGVRGIAALTTMLAAGRVGDARRIADAHEPSPHRAANWARQILPFFEGDAHSALHLAGEDVAYAEQRLDRTLFASSAYTSAMVQHFLGQYRAVQRSVDAMVLIGRPRLDYTAMYTAALNIQSLIAVFTGQFDARDSFFSESATLMPQPGPFLGMGTDTFQPMLVVRGPSEASDRTAADTVRRRASLGYHTAAAQSAAAILVLAYGPRTAFELRETLRLRDLPVYRTAASLTELIDGGAAPDALGTFLQRRASRDQDSLLRSLLRAAARRALADGEQARAQELESVAARAFDSAVLTAPDPPEFGGPSPAESLTEREKEVVLLAGTRTNREVADRLGISVRTVENHLARAARKTGTRRREEMFALVEALG